MTAIRSDLDLVSLLVQILLGDRRVAPGEDEWTAVSGLARRHGVLLRLADRLREHPVQVPFAFRFAVEEARSRADTVLGLAARVGATCEYHRVPHVFLGVAHECPDVGRDVDVLVAHRDPQRDAPFIDRLSIGAIQRTTGNRIAGTVSYEVPEAGTRLDVHHHRLGRLGEQTRLAVQMLGRRRSARVGTVTLQVPSPEDQVLRQALALCLGRRALRIRDVLWTMRAIAAGSVRWEAVEGVARATGLAAALRCHLDFTDQVHHLTVGRPLITPALRRRLGLGSWGRLTFGSGLFRFNALRVNAQIVGQEFQALARSGEWRDACRLVLVPFVVAAAGWRRALR